MNHLEWNKVTWYSKLGALILFVVVIPVLTFVIGREYEKTISALKSVNTLTASSQVSSVYAAVAPHINEVTVQLTDTKPKPPESVATSQSYNQTSFISEKLGIAFTHSASLKTQVMGNKVYVFPEGIKPTRGQFIEVFKKPENESLKAAIERIILADNISERCTVKTSIIKATGFKRAQITYPPPENPNEPFWANIALCDENYAESNSVRYFTVDPKFPSKFFFLDLGHATSETANTVLWSDTLTVIN